MKITTIGTIAAVALIALSGQAVADEKLEIGQKIYERSFGRGCGTCHDISSNPQLFALVKAGTLDRARFEKVLKEGKGGMPKAIEEVLKVKAVTTAGYGEDQAVDALYAYLGSK
ncbi:MAG: cytochrome c [Methylococcaceae bacterium]|nr:cytochrome c [Methylococcaceae bacterium]MDZ4155055.1 cytochrome c [Methylococcales bacterium]MDP2394500.1 cytochrome c [Methylococcaceae bacterium]MDP3021543.1 cytochrome c [Methylococcaceae bacterium]MDP3388669.1 cytochrome c [Methylococcaceae bacterium]